MNVVFTCGGTAGHINPAIAVANIWKERHPEGKVLFIGGDDMEMELVPKAGYELVGFPSASFCRGLNMHAFRHNARAVGLITRAISKCKRVLQDFQADVVIGTGGYASFPALEAARRLHLPTCVHESNAMPGLTTRMVADWVDRVLICFPESAKHYRHPEKAEVVGMPVRREFLFNDRAKARKALGIGEDEWVVLSAFGSQGAREMNYAVGRMLALEQADGFPFHPIHAAGKSDWPHVSGELERLGLSSPLLDVRQYIYDMAVVMAAADLVISRAGASTLSEVTALGMPTILVPSPYVVANHQEKNARLLESHGGAVVLTEEQATGEALYESAKDILQNPEKRRSMAKAMAELGIPDATERIYNTLMALL